MTADFVETDVKAIEEIYDRLWATFYTHRTQTIEYRLYNLKQLAFLITDNADAITKAVNDDLGKTAKESILAEQIPTLNEIELAVRKLPEWMKDESATKDVQKAFALSRPRVKKQPKGVALIIGAWNYPFQLTLSPLVGAIAAGCPAVIKTSEHAPASAMVLADLIPKYLDPEGYAVVNGAVEQSTALLSKRWGHICYTGGGAVGKIVAGAAAKTLTPSTLELGGKSPTIVCSDADVDIAARRMVSIKQMNVGQVCVSPDYVLVVKDKVDAFSEALTKALAEFHPPGHERSFLNDNTSAFIRNDNDFNRFETVLNDVGDKVIYRGESDRSRLRMGISVVLFDKNAEGEQSWLVRDEIFGPIINIIPVDDVDSAIEYINARPNPLALYVASASRKNFEYVVDRTLSGSAIWNDHAFTPIIRTVPFGGVGESGWGAYHGIDGFLTFSHRRAIIEVPYWMEFAQKNRYAPNANPKNDKMLHWAMSSGVPFKRPVSVEDERRALNRRRNRRTLYLCLLIAGLGAGFSLGATGIVGILTAVRARLGF